MHHLAGSIPPHRYALGAHVVTVPAPSLLQLVGEVAHPAGVGVVTAGRISHALSATAIIFLAKLTATNIYTTLSVKRPGFSRGEPESLYRYDSP